VHLGNTAFEVFSIPGHTPGSAAYLVKGVLFVGDAINLSKSQKAKPPIWFFSNDVDQGVASVRKLAERLKPRANEIKFIATRNQILP
jgi:glyoxylase-like metal-dependent hydrolase (beta-lactamase superfamily II)